MEEYDKIIVNGSEVTVYPEPCIVCEKEIKHPRRAKWVRMNCDNEIISPYAEIPEIDDMGCYPIGNECWKKVIPKELVSEYKKVWKERGK